MSYSPNSLKGIKLKVRRASVQLKRLKLSIQRFDAGHPYRIDKYVNPDTGEFGFHFALHRHWHDDWAILIGEYIHNLRSALDHLVYELVRLETGHPPPLLGRTQFPIFDREFDEKKPGKRKGFHSGAKPMLVGVGDTARALIEREQPYKTGERQSSPLWHLHELSNWDKHRTIHLTHALSQSFTIEAPFPAVHFVHCRQAGPLKNGAILGGGMFALRDRPLSEWVDQVDVKFKFTADIGFEHPHAVKGLLVRPTLSAIGGRVVRILNSVHKDVFDKSPP